jgi:hypothetical protein
MPWIATTTIRPFNRAAHCMVPSLAVQQMVRLPSANLPHLSAGIIGGVAGGGGPLHVGS